MKKLKANPVLLLATFLLAGSVGMQGCGSARRSEPIRGPLEVRSQQIENGKTVFMQNCQKCHPGGEAGLGPSLNNVPLPGGAIRFRVRSKAFLLGLGRMPSFKKHEISKEKLDELVFYMKVLKKNKTDAMASGD